MSKERLEEIKEHFAYCMDEGLLFAEQEEKLLEELYTQAERVEIVSDTLNQEVAYSAKLERQNKRYRDYLKQIKDYMIDDINTEVETSPHFIKNICDEALEGSE